MNNGMNNNYNQGNMGYGQPMNNMPGQDPNMMGMQQQQMMNQNNMYNQQPQPSYGPPQYNSEQPKRGRSVGCTIVIILLMALGVYTFITIHPYAMAKSDMIGTWKCGEQHYTFKKDGDVEVVLDQFGPNIKYVGTYETKISKPRKDARKKNYDYLMINISYKEVTDGTDTASFNEKSEFIFGTNGDNAHFVSDDNVDNGGIACTRE